MNKSILFLVAFMAVVALSVAIRPPTPERMIKKGTAVRCILENNCYTKDWKKKLMTPRMYNKLQNVEMEILIGVVAKNADSIEASLYERSTPGSPLYRKWLSFEEIGRRYRNDKAIAMIEEWIESSGAKKIETLPNGEFIRVRVTVEVAEKMFNTKFHTYYSASLDKEIVRTEIFYLPESIHPLVDVVSGLTTFPMTLDRPSIFLGSKVEHVEADGNTTPQLLNTYYGITSNTVKNTDKVTQSLFESLGQDYSPSDLAQFESAYGIPSQAIAKVIGPNNPNACQQNPNNCGEANLDVQYIIAVAQGAPTTYWSIPNSNADIYLEWATAVAADNSAPIVHSISYGSIESEEDSSAMTKFNSLVANFGQRGLTVMVASGDDGVANFIARSDPSKCGFNPSFPATSPYVTAVGATQGPEDGQPEVACSSKTGGLVTTGGGFSASFSAPSYQSSAISGYFSSGVQLPPSGDYASSGRGYPDVAMLGHNYIVYIAGQPIQVSGTSAASPVFAGVISLANDQLVSSQGTTLGFINPTLYQMSSSSFNDITSGENNCCAGQSNPVCCEYGFFATAGWDPLTGFGSTKFSTFVQNIIAGGGVTSGTSGTSGSGSTSGPHTSTGSQTSGSTHSGTTSQSSTGSPSSSTGSPSSSTGSPSSSTGSTGSQTSSTGTGSSGSTQSTQSSTGSSGSSGSSASTGYTSSSTHHHSSTRRL